MSNDNQKLLVYFDNEEDLVRRFGAAVVSCWAELDPATQARLLDVARRILDEVDDERLDERMAQLLAGHGPHRGHRRPAA